MPRRHRSIVSELANLLRAAAQAHSQVGGAQAGGGGGSVRWGGQQFENAPALVAWINAHGGHQTVPGFLSTHPGAASIFAGGGQPNYAGAGQGPGMQMPLPGAGGTDAVLPGAGQFSLPALQQLGRPGPFPLPRSRQPETPAFGLGHLMALLGHGLKTSQRVGPASPGYSRAYRRRMKQHLTQQAHPRLIQV